MRLRPLAIVTIGLITVLATLLFGWKGLVLAILFFMLLLLAIRISLLRLRMAYSSGPPRVAIAGLPATGNGPAYVGPCHGPDLLEIQEQIVAAINLERHRHELQPLRVDPGLLAAARSHASRMAILRRVTHDDPCDGDMVTRISRYCPCGVCGENLGRVKALNEPARVVLGSWMRSRKHRRNILHPSFAITAVGVAQDQRSGNLYVSQVFADQPKLAIYD